MPPGAHYMPDVCVSFGFLNKARLSPPFAGPQTQCPGQGHGRSGSPRGDGGGAGFMMRPRASLLRGRTD